MASIRSIRILLSFASLALLTGCIAQAPTPGFARTGDVVNIGLGGIKRNTGPSGMRYLAPSDLVVTITDAAAVVHNVQILGTYRAFPDYTSQYAVSAQDRADPNYGQLLPYDGAVWLTIRLFDSNSGPLPLAVGPAEISIASSSLTQTGFSYDGNYSSIPIEILPGIGTPSLTDSQNQAYQTNTFLTVSPDSTTGLPEIGGAQIVISFPSLVTFDDPYEMRMVPLTHDPNLGLIQSITDNGDGTKTLKAIVSNPNGFVPQAVWSQGKSSLLDLRMALVSADGLAAFQNWQTAFIIDVDNSFYVDTAGDRVTGVVPVLSNEFE